LAAFKAAIVDTKVAQHLSATSFKVVCKECNYQLVLGENFENVGKDFTIDSYCPNCGARVSKEVPAVFTPLGYSIRENGGYGIFYGYEINQEALAEYQAYLEANNKSATFGVLIANAANFGTNSFISSDGTLGTTSGIKVDMSLDCKIVNCYINGFTKNKVDLSLVMAIYTIEDGIVTYVQKDGTYAGEVTQGGVTLNVVTFRKIAELVGRTDIDIIVPIEPKDEQE
jgi:rRNA maturation protein Nop10